MVSKTSPQQSVSKYQPRKKEAWLYEIPKQEAMQTNVHIYADEAMLAKLQEDGSLQQGINVACLPGLVGNVCMMPDAHQGYGFPIGGVAAFDAHNGIVTPGGIGFDINCGVRLLATTLTKEQVLANIHQLLDELFVRIPSGVGKESTIKLSKDALDAVLQYGAHWAVEQGYGTKEDAVLAEEGGMLRAADPKAVSQKAKARGIAQLGTLGAGNHFLEIQYVDAVYDPTTAARMRITGKGQVVVMIHCGSRGLGHQVCSDYLKKMEDVFPQLQKKLPEKDLVYAPLSSKQAEEYLCAM
ncbi:MAG: RtcB family protein, partial [Candidatus Woesearchaeota archaeon]